MAQPMSEDEEMDALRTRHRRRMAAIAVIVVVAFVLTSVGFLVLTGR